MVPSVLWGWSRGMAGHKIAHKAHAFASLCPLRWTLVILIFLCQFEWLVSGVCKYIYCLIGLLVGLWSLWNLWTVHLFLGFCMPWFVCGSQGTACGNWLSPSTVGPRDLIQVPGLHYNDFYPLNHPAWPKVFFPLKPCLITGIKSAFSKRSQNWHMLKLETDTSDS